VSWYQKKHSPTHITREEEEGEFAQTTRPTAWEPIPPTMDQYAGSPGHSTYCCAELASSFINILCSPSSGFYDAGKDNRGRRTGNPSGRHPIRTIGDPPPSSAHFTPTALSAATLPIYPVLRQALNNAGLHARWLDIGIGGLIVAK